MRAIVTGANPRLFLTRPNSGTLIALLVASVILALWRRHLVQARLAPPSEHEAEF